MLVSYHKDFVREKNFKSTETFKGGQQNILGQK